MPRLHRTSGNTLTEYGFIGAIILLGCFAVLWSLGGGMQTQLSGVQSDMEASARQALITRLQSTGNSMTVTQDDGSALTLTQDMLNAGEARATTSGALGNEGALGSYMVNGIDFRNARITPAQGEMLVRLANQAYYLGFIAEAIERLAVRSGGDQDRFRNMTIYFDGQQQQAQHLSNLLSYDQEALRTFRNLRDEMTGSSMDPAVRDYVYNLSRQVEVAINRTRSTARAALTQEADPLEISRLETAIVSHEAGDVLCDTSQRGRSLSRAEQRACEDAAATATP